MGYTMLYPVKGLCTGTQDGTEGYKGELFKTIGVCLFSVFFLEIIFTYAIFCS